MLRPRIPSVVYPRNDQHTFRAERPVGAYRITQYLLFPIVLLRNLHNERIGVLGGLCDVSNVYTTK